MRYVFYVLLLLVIGLFVLSSSYDFVGEIPIRGIATIFKAGDSRSAKLRSQQQEREEEIRQLLENNRYQQEMRRIENEYRNLEIQQKLQEQRDRQMDSRINIEAQQDYMRKIREDQTQRSDQVKKQYEELIDSREQPDRL